MPEKTKKNEGRYPLDPVAFALALVCAPLIVALLGFWALAIPIFAVLFGGPIYLVFGTPVLLTYLLYRRGSPEGAALLGFLTVIVGLVGLWLLGTAFGRMQDIEPLLWMGGFGLIFGPLWGLTFGLLYNRWRNEQSRQPLPALA